MAKCCLRTSGKIFTFAISGHLLSRARAKIDITHPLRAYLSDVLKADPQQLDVSIADGEKQIPLRHWGRVNVKLLQNNFKISPEASGYRYHPLAHVFVYAQMGMVHFCVLKKGGWFTRIHSCPNQHNWILWPLDSFPLCGEYRNQQN